MVGLLTNWHEIDEPSTRFGGIAELLGGGIGEFDECVFAGTWIDGISVRDEEDDSASRSVT